jgi:hypothetical protein
MELHDLFEALAWLVAGTIGGAGLLVAMLFLTRPGRRVLKIPEAAGPAPTQTRRGDDSARGKSFAGTA